MRISRLAKIDVISRFEPTEDMEEVRKAVEAAL